MLRIVTFGEATIWLGRERLAPTASRMFALGLYLGAERGRDVPRSVLQALLFPESDERSASHSLRQLVYRMRQLGAQLESSADSIAIGTERVSDDYSALVSAPELEAEQIALATKGFMPGYAPGFSEAFADWVDAFRSRTTLEIRRKALAAMDDARARCNWAAVAHAAHACLALDPLNEDATIGLAESLAMTGSKAEALARLDRYEEELPPGAQECRAAARRLRHRIASRVAEPSPVSLRDMPLVGREEEMRRLTTALAHTRTNGGGVVLITGEPGIGKTRLITEFARVAALSGAQTARVVCRAATSHQPLSPFIELTRQLLQMPGALGCSPEALEALRGLCHHPAQQARASDAGVFDAQSVFDSNVHAILDLVDAVAGEQPLVLVIDDVHTMDAASADVLCRMQGVLEHCALLLLLSSRDPNQAEILTCGDERTARIRLGPLDALQSGVLLRFALGSAEQPLSFVKESDLLLHANGNPLLVKLLVAHYAAGGLGTGSRPVALAELLQRRLDTLTADGRTVLECCVVLGRHASLARFEQCLNLPTISLANALRELEWLGLLSLEGQSLLVAHPIIAELAGHAMLPSVRLLLHRRVAQLLAVEYEATGDANLLWDCADHWEQAGDAPQATIHLRRCAAHSLSLGRPDTAANALGRALSIRPLPARTRIAVLADAISLTEIAGEWSRIGGLLQEIEDACAEPRHRGDVPAASEVLRLDALRIAGDLDAVDLSPVLRLLRSEAAPPAARVRAATFLVSHAEESFDCGLADVVRQVVPSIPSHSVEADELLSKYWLIDETVFGDITRAREMGTRLLASWSGMGLQPKRVNSCFVLAFSLVRCGESPLAAGLLEALRVCLRSWSLQRQELRCLCYLAWIALRGRSLDKAHEWHSEAGSLVARLGGEAPLLFHSNAVEILILQRKALAAMAEIDTSARRFASLSRGKMRLQLLELRARARSMAGLRPCSDEELSELLDGHFRSRRFGLHDEIAEAVYLALRAAERQIEAEELLQEYVATHRRDPFPLSQELKALVAASEIPGGALRQRRQTAVEE